MNRRTFLGALAAVLAAPSILAKLRPKPLRYEEMPLGLLDITMSTEYTRGSALIPDGDYEASPRVHGVDYVNVYRDRFGFDWVAAPQQDTPPTGMRWVGERTLKQLDEALRS